MANAQRSRLAVEAWREHLITAPEALEMAGLQSEEELQALSASVLQDSSGEGEETAQ